VHISQLADYRVDKVEDIAKLGDELTAMVIDVDPGGKVRMSRQAVLEGWSVEEAQSRDRGGRSGGDRGSRSGDRGPRRDGDRGGRPNGDRGPRRDDRGPRPTVALVATTAARGGRRYIPCPVRTPRAACIRRNSWRAKRKLRSPFLYNRKG
jgi:hypothetical protein